MYFMQFKLWVQIGLIDFNYQTVIWFTMEYIKIWPCRAPLVLICSNSDYNGLAESEVHHSFSFQNVSMVLNKYPLYMKVLNIIPLHM